MGRIIAAFAQFFDGAGDPLADGWLEFLESGSNNTQKDSYNDAQLQIPNENPLRLDGEGRCPSSFGQGNYRVVLYQNDPEDETQPGDQIAMFDPVFAAIDDVIGGGGGTGFEFWDSTVTYNLGDIVTHSNKYYRSLVGSNLNLNPAIEFYAWEEIEFLSVWNDTITYEEGDLARYLYQLYFSRQAGNINNQPDESPDYWRRLESQYAAKAEYIIDHEVLPTERDYLFVLGSSAVADRTFTLPVTDATYDNFRVWFYNASDYNLIIDSLDAKAIWLDTISLSKGAFIEVIYNHDLTQWLINDNFGPAMGGQDIGTASFPVATLYADDINVLNSLNIPTDIYLYFGNSQEGSIRYFSGGNSFYFSSTNNIDFDAGADLSIATGADFYIDATGDFYLNVNPAADIFFQFSSTTHWQMANSGEILPGGSNPNPDLGAAGSPLDAVYADNFYASALGRFDIDGELFLYHNSVDGYLTCNTGNLRLAVTGTDDILFITNFGTMALFEDTGDAYFYKDVLLDTDTGSIYLGADQDLRLRYSGSSGSIGCNDQLFIGTETSNTLFFFTNAASKWGINNLGTFYPVANNSYDFGSSSNRVKTIYAVNGNFTGAIAGNISWSGDISLGDNDQIYFGAGPDGNISSNGTDLFLTASGSSDLHLSTISGDVLIKTGGTIRWRFIGLDMLPYTTSQDIGSTTYRVDTIYTVNALNVSDFRYKKDVKQSILGLDFINALNPISYRLTEFENQRIRYGLIAQEVNQLLSKFNMSYNDFSGIHYDKKTDRWDMDYSQFIAPIIQAIKELRGLINDKIN